MTGWPSVCDIPKARIRPNTSADTPAPKGTSMGIGRVGKVCARAIPDTAGSVAAPAARCRNDLRGSSIMTPPVVCWRTLTALCAQSERPCAPGSPAVGPRASRVALAPGPWLWDLGADDGPKTCRKHAGLHVLGPLALRHRPLVPAERSAARLAHQSGGLGVPSSNLGAPTTYDQ